MGILKVLSIIGIVWFSLSLIFIIAFGTSNPTASIGWGVQGMAYAIPLSIVVLVKSFKSEKKSEPIKTVAEELIRLHELKEKQIISEAEFDKKKAKLLE